MSSLLHSLLRGRISKRLCVFFFLFLFSQQVNAQLIPGMRANGRPVNQGDTVTICIGSSVTYLSTAQNFNSINWIFDVGTGTPVTSTTAASVVVPYGVAGIFPTWQFITSGANRDSMYMYVRVNSTKPVAGFNFTPNNQCGDITVNFTNTSTGNGLSYAWTFEPAAQVSNSLNPSYQFLNAIGASGTTSYPVKLVVTNDQTCKDSSVQTVVVKNIPDASIDRGAIDFTYGVFNGVPTFKKCDASQTFQFKFLNISTTPAIISNYTIKWGDGTPDSIFTSWPVNTVIVAHTFPRGQSSMQIIATGTNGCIGIKNYNVFIGNNPAGGILTPGNTAVCNSSGLNQLTFPINGTAPNSVGYFYTITVNDGSPQITYQHPPPSSYTHTFTTTSCGTTSTDGTNTYPNSFSVNMTISSPCFTSGSTVTPIGVSGKPRAQFVAPQNVCMGSSISIFSSSNYGNIVNGSTCTNNGKIIWSISPATYTLSSGILGSINGNINNPLIWTAGSAFLGVNFLQPGIYTIKLIAANDGNCGMDSITRTICVRTPPTASFTMNKQRGCAPDTLSITNTSPIGTCQGETYNWQISYIDNQNCGTSAGFAFVGGTSSTSRDPRIRFTTPGMYIIKLTETALATGCPSPVFQDTFYVKAKPRISVSIPSVCIGNPTAATATVTNCYSTQTPIYNWTFTGATPPRPDSLNPGTVIYGSVGTYSVVFTATNECGLTSATGSAVVTNTPNTDAGPDKPVCSGSTTSIGVSIGTGFTYSWSPTTYLSNPSSAVTSITPIYTGTNADTVLVYVLTASAGASCSKSDSVLVTVKRKPVVVVNPVSVAICGGGTAVLAASGATTYTWSPGTGLSSTTADTVNASPATTTPYTVTGTLNGCSATAQVTVNVTAQANVNAGPDSMVCNSSTAVQFTGTPAGGSWTGHPNITSGGLFNPSLAGIGAYTLYYTAGTGVCLKTDSMLVTVISATAARAGNDTIICQRPGTLQLIGLPAGGSWSGSPLITTSGLFTTNTPGTYSLIYRIGSGSCIARDTMVITVNGGITNNLIAANQSICPGSQPLPINGQLVSGGGGSAQYQWQVSSDSLVWTNIAGPAGTTQNYTPPVATQTFYYRRLASTSLCAGSQTDTSAPVKITIYPDAKALFTASKTIGCTPFRIDTVIHLTQYPAADSAYRWYVNGALIGSGVTCPPYTMTVPGDTITVKLVAISRYGCKNDSMQIGFKTIPQPVTAFSQSDSVKCGPFQVTFTNQTVNPGLYTYYWNFGNGQTSVLQQPGPVTFDPNPRSGDTVYTIRFVTITPCDSIVLLRYVRVKAKPKVLFTPDRSTGCSGYNFTFTNTSGGIGNSYTWDFGDGSPTLSTNAAQVNHIYHVGNNTTFLVKLKAINECGTDSLVYNLLVQPVTIRPDFAVNSNELFGCAPHTVHFINNSQGGSTFDWDFGDGGTLNTFLNVDTVTHTFLQPGTYIIKMRTRNNCSDTTDTETIIVYAKPAVSFTANPLIACFGDTIRFTNTSDTGLTYNWRFGDGGTSLQRNPLHIYNTGGVYRVWLTGTRANPSGVGCADSAFKDIQIRDTLPGSFYASDTLLGCLPATVIFKNNNRPSALTTWTFGDGGTATGDSVNHTYTQTGVYTVKMISRGIAGCTYAATKTIVVTNPSGTLLYTGGYLCPNIPLRMEVVSNNATQIRYVFGNGDSLTTTNGVVFYSYPQPGAYVPYAYVIIGACQVRLVRGDTVKVDRLHTGFRSLQQQQCGSTTIAFSDTSNAFFGIRSRTWDFGDGSAISTLQNPVHIYNQSGTYTVKLRVTGNSNCVDTFALAITVVVHNKPVSTISGNATACIGQPLSLTALVQSTDAIAATDWSFGNGATASGTSVSTTYNAAGTYTIRLISRTSFGCADTVYKAIQVNVTPTVNAGPDVRICRGQSVQLGAIGANTWQWTPLQNLSCVNCANPVANPLFTTSYIVAGTNSVSCSNTDTIVVEVIQPFTMTVSPTDTLCIGDSVQLFAGGGYSYTWTPAASLDNAFIANPIAKPAATTVYQVVGRDRYNCFTNTDYVRVNVGQYPTVNLGTGGIVGAGSTVTFNPAITNGPIIRYAWSPITDLSCTACPNPVATINRDIIYKLEVTNNYGCKGSDTIQYKVTCDPKQLYIPNAFSPDGDGKNDVFMIRGTGIATIKHLYIFNRFGQLVFERSNINANDVSQGWDGKFKGVPMQPDVYVVSVEALCTGGALFPYKGNVTLVR